MSSSEIGLGNSRPLKSRAMYFIGNYFSPFFFLYSQLLFVFCKICLSPHSFISARPNAFRKYVLGVTTWMFSYLPIHRRTPFCVECNDCWVLPNSLSYLLLQEKAIATVRLLTQQILFVSV